VAEFLSRVNGLNRDQKYAGILAVTLSGEQITPRMKSLRDSPLAYRTAAYIADRIGKQRSWYIERAILARRRASVWSLALLSTELIAVCFAVIRAADLVDLDLLGIAAATVAAGAAWLQARQYRELANSYALTSQELASAASAGANIASNEDLEKLAEGVESAISRENSFWLARRAI
jgi:hypothetical protein